MPSPLNLAWIKFAAGAAVAGAAGVGAWVAFAPASAPSGSSSTVAQGAPGDGDDNVVCVGPDAVFRTPAANGACRDGERRFVLAPRDRKAKDAGCIGCDPWEPKAKPADDPLADIERRIDALEHASLFEVIDKRGRLILSVAPERVFVYNGDELSVAGLLAIPKGGVLKAQSPDGARVVSLGAGGASGGLRVEEDGRPRVDLGRQPAGNYALRFPLNDGALAGIGESRAGSGVLLIADNSGRLQASMQLAGGKAALGVFGNDGTALLSLTEGRTGGLLALANRSGEGMVKMGVNNGRYGVVLAGPRAGFPLVPKSGLPGSYFLGCAGGEGCVP